MESLWIETTKDKLNLKALDKEEKTEVCVIGGGLLGLTTAYYLTLAGKKVILLEKDDIGEKTSGNTTGKKEDFVRCLLSGKPETEKGKYGQSGLLRHAKQICVAV